MGDVRDDRVSFTAVDPRPGATLGRYELLVPIASGGMAHVWAARLLAQGGFTKVVALKTILPDFAAHRQFQTMFLDEARIAAKLRHPNICETFDLGEERGSLYLTMEWVDGPSLLQLVRAGASPPDATPIDARIAARIVADAAAGLQAAHELVDDDGTPLHVVHRDVSPHNILVSSSGLVKVTDFGVAKARGKSHLTAAGEIKGKVAYMAPEQLLASEAIDGRCDVFALGCVLFEITTGRRAFPGSGDGEVVSAILTGHFAKPSDVVPSFPPELEAVVLRAMARDVADRFPSADALRAALESFLAGSGAPVTAANVAALVRERAGDEIGKRRDAIRAACAGRSPPLQLSSTPSDPVLPRRPSASDRSEKAVAVDAVRPPVLTRPAAPPSRAVFLAAIAVAAGALVFGGGLLFAFMRAKTPVASAASSERPATGLVAPPPSIAPVIAPLSGTKEGTEGTTTLSPRISFHLTPPNAVLVVDGVALPPGVDTIQRPPEGRAIRVVVRADRHDDQAITIDAATPASIDVSLVTRTGAKGPRARPATSASAPTGGAALPNPYE